MNFYFDLNNEYPDITINEENKEYGFILLQDYAGNNGKLTMITSYFYQILILSDEYIDVKNILKQILLDNIKHLEILGKIIKLLGVNPKFRTIECYTNKNIYWDSKNVNYEVDIVSILNSNIESKINSINNYKAHLEFIDDINIKNILTRIMEDEKNHKKLFENLLEKYIKEY